MIVHCLLTEPLLPVETGGVAGWRTLPGVLADLAADRVDDVPDLGAHQQQTFYQFLVQLAALALARQAGDGEADADAPPPDDEDGWRFRLLALAPAAAWTLINDQLGEPAFLQPPVPEVSLEGFTPLAVTADGIETLVTSRAVDVKPARAAASRPHHWAYALVSLQTSMGYLGRGNFGVCRMNGGFSSRPMLELAPASLRWGARFRRAVRVLLRERERLFRDPDLGHLYRPNGRTLLWLEPWDGREGPPPRDLEPHFIEICRRVRLVRHGDAVVALGRPTDGARLNAKDRAGHLGDPWMPVDRVAGKAVTFQAGAFGYRRLTKLLTDGQGVVLPPAALPQDGDGDRVVLHATVLVRGQGGTEGLETRTLPLSTRTARRLWRNQTTPDEALRALCAAMLGDARHAADALRAGLAMAVQHRTLPPGGRPDLDEPAAKPGVDALERAIDEVFFDHLWSRLEAADDARVAADARWRRALRAAAAVVFRRELERLPTDAARIGPSRAAAQILFNAVLNHHLPMPETAPAAGEETTDDDTGPDAVP